MLCKVFNNTKYWVTLLVLGTISFSFGVIGYSAGMQLTGNSDMLLGMFTGLGSCFVVVSVIMLLVNRFKSEAKRKQEQIQLKDERNIQITRNALSISSIVALLLFAVMAFVFVALDYEIPSIIAIGAMWIQAIAFLAARAIISQRI